MTPRATIYLLSVLLSGWALPARAAVEGTVTTPAGAPVEGARVELVESGAARVTDSRGRFRFGEAAEAVRVRIEHPRFHPLEFEIAASESDEPRTFVLQPKREVYEEIVVSATRDAAADGFHPVSVASTSLAPEDRTTPAATVVELIESAPGVAENGQGGLFQAYSIRGIAGQRVLTILSGARIVTERRAGATASFVDPLLLGRADLLRGPSSTFYGSGALGGVLQLFPRRFEGLRARGGYSSQGDETYQQLGWGGSGWSLGLAHRRAGDSKTADGELLFSRYEQWSATIAREWEPRPDTTLGLLILPALARDIGKPNTRLPERVTAYPEENHLLARISLRRAGRWRIDLFAHPNELLTENLTAEERSLVENRAFDLGLNAQWELTLPQGVAGRLGIDYFGRRGVEASEQVRELDSGRLEVFQTLDGEEDEVALYAALRRALGRATAELGGRFTWLRQANRGAASATDSAWTGFAGLTVPVAAGFEVAANLGAGLRFPGLSERFFSGSTGRGEVIANRDLEPERSLSFDLGVRYYGQRLYLSAFGFRSDIDDYIERVDVAPGVRTFVNLTSGTIEGLEAEGFLQLSAALRLEWSGQSSQGRGADGDPLSDIAADRIELGARYSRQPWTVSGRIQHRFSKSDPGSGERPVPSAEIVSASISYRLRRDLTLTLTGRNLLDETYLPSADELAQPAPGRSLGIEVGWAD